MPILKQSMESSQRHILPRLNNRNKIIRKIDRAAPGSEIHVGDRNVHCPVSRPEFPEDVERDDDWCCEVLFEECLGVGGSSYGLRKSLVIIHTMRKKGRGNGMENGGNLHKEQRRMWQSYKPNS